MQERKFLLYMDILGTKQIINSGSYETIIELVHYFNANNREFKIDYKEIKDDPKARYEVTNIDPTISNFSDHLIASYPSNYTKAPYASIQASATVFIHSLICIAVQFHKQALEKEVLMRGIITEGVLLHTSNCVVGKALNEAVELEEKIAIYPRVVVSEKIIKMMLDYGLNPRYASLKRDFDGIFFIDYLKDRFFVGFDLVASFTSLQIIIEKNLKKYDDNESKNIAKLAKWRWLANKFDESLDFFHQKEKTIKNDLAKIPKFNIFNM